MVKNKHQLEFMSVSRDEHVLVAASLLVNSSNWTGQLWCFTHESNLVPGIIDENENCLEYHLSQGTASGIFLDNDSMLVGNDIGMVAIYGYDIKGEENPDNPMMYNKVSRTEHDRSVLSLSVTETAQKFLSGSMDRSVKLWDTETFVPLVSYDQAHTSYVPFVGFLNPDGNNEKLFVSASFDGSLLLWDLRNSNSVQVLLEESDYRPTHVEWFKDSDNLLFVGCDYGTVRLIDRRHAKDPIFIHEFSRGRSVNTIRSYTHGSKKYLSICGNTTIMKVYEFDEKLHEIFSNDSHGDYIQDTAWLSKSETLLSCSWDSRVMKHKPFLADKNLQGDS